MPSFKINLTHEHEDQVVLYCVKNNIDFNQANAYEVTLEAFKENPIVYKSSDNGTGEETEYTVTPRIARLIECQPRTVDRLADKVLWEKEKYKKNIWNENIKKSKAVSIPNLDKLVENLYRLNIVDKNSYLALVCFLMQLKYTRDKEIIENDKTCVFFNGVARNGKSATAKAICDIEAQYGEVYSPGSGTILEAVHEEMVWKSHLNYFDEVKPSDLMREKLLSIVNGGEKPVNPKNKRQYVQHVNTNNIFTSNGQIYLKQRRVSVVKFGNQLNGRPLEVGTLKKIIAEIMSSLPSFERYYDIYHIVRTANQARINPLAVSSIITYMNKKLHYVKDGDGASLNNTITFAPHDINNCVKNIYSKQILQSERIEGVLQALEDFVQKGLMEEIVYERNTTRHFKVTGENYLRIMAEFDKMNTANENNIKISAEELRDLLLPYFTETDSDNEIEEIPQSSKTLVKTENVDVEQLREEPPFIPEENLKRGRILWNRIYSQIEENFPVDDGDDEYEQKTLDEKPEILHELVSPKACQYLRLDTFIDLFEEYYSKELITQAYINQTGLKDPEVRKIAEKEKYCLSYESYRQNKLYTQRKRCGELSDN